MARSGGPESKIAVPRGIFRARPDVQRIAHFELVRLLIRHLDGLAAGSLLMIFGLSGGFPKSYREK